MEISFMRIFIILAYLVVIYSRPEESLLYKIQNLKDSRQLKGIQLQLTIDSTITFNANLG
jgi:hypothetical protein